MRHLSSNSSKNIEYLIITQKLNLGFYKSRLINCVISFRLFLG